jgi:hypothetical protein
VKRLLHALLLAAFAAAFVFYAKAAAADPATENAAKELRRKAVEEDSLNMDYTAAIDKLTQAATKCGENKCSKELRAQLQQDIGFMQYSATHDRDKALAAFAAALRIDPDLALANDYKTGEIEALWEQAKRGGGPSNPPPTENPDAGASDQNGGTPTGDYNLTPPDEGQNRTPLPIYVEYTGTAQLTKVEIRYKGRGMSSFKTAALRKVGTGYGGVIPCEDVVTGDLVFFIQGTDNEGNSVTLGGPHQTFTVPIKPKFEGEPPHLPGQAAPAMCPEKGDCPEGLVGCHTAGEGDKKDEGAECEQGEECKSGKCENQQCTAPEESSSPSAFRRWWVGVGVSADILLIGSSDNVCKLHDVGTAGAGTPLASGYYCANPDGSDYPSRQDPTQNAKLVTGAQDQVQGGFAFPPQIRIMASLDFAVTKNLMLGARFGYVLGTFPGAAAGNDGKSFAPIHGELRGTYLFGDGLTKLGFVPFVMLGGGVSEYDAHVDVNVVEMGTPGTKTVQAWAVNSPVFLSVGPGIRYAISPRTAVMLPLKFTASIGGAGLIPVIAPELSFQVGF